MMYFETHRIRQLTLAEVASVMVALEDEIARALPFRRSPVVAP
jgi:hypothetical protein